MASRSFQCDGHRIQERRYHCCRVNGALHCATTLVDTTAMDPSCNCHQNNVSVAQDGRNRGEIEAKQVRKCTKNGPNRSKT